ncbi:MAG: FecR domain-containing protein [Bacteroidota bacterium]
MDEQQIADLIKKYNDNTLDHNEKLALDMWYLKFAAESTNALDEKLEAKMSAKLQSALPLTYKKRTVKLWPRIAGIAAILAMVVGAGMWFYIGNQKEPIYVHLTANDIPPGKMGATLTLANGKEIRLSSVANGELANESGISISKTDDGQILYQIEAQQSNPNATNTLSTAIGETYIVTLPDQTRVWLNAASSLTYNPALTTNGVRKVKLTGEGYFEVAKDPSHPFIVESGAQSVEVLGTHFNINAYPDEKALKTTLLEGSVKILPLLLPGGTTMQSFEPIILKPSHQAILTGNKIQVKESDTEFAVAWKSNNFVFDRLDIREIMRMIARWYNVEIIYQEGLPAGTFWGSVSRFDNISKVLIPLEATGDVHFKIEGRKIYVLK